MLVVNVREPGAEVSQLTLLHVLLDSTPVTLKHSFMQTSLLNTAASLSSPFGATPLFPIPHQTRILLTFWSPFPDSLS